MRAYLPLAVVVAIALPAAAMPPPLPEVADASMAALQRDVAAGRASSEAIASAYIVRGKVVGPRTMPPGSSPTR